MWDEAGPRRFFQLAHHVLPGTWHIRIVRPQHGTVPWDRTMAPNDLLSAESLRAVPGCLIGFSVLRMRFPMMSGCQGATART